MKMHFGHIGLSYNLANTHRRTTAKPNRTYEIYKL